ncbi:MAG: 30S ribosomal protein S6 [Candidatus Peregrinibacteria bacterium]
MPSLTPTTEEGRIYELCVLYPYPLQQKEEQDVLKAIEHIFSEAGAVQITKDIWGRRGLAYAIKGSTEGCFVVYHYEVDPTKIREIDEAIRITPNVLRHLLIKPPKGYQVVAYSEQFNEWQKQKGEADIRLEKAKEEKLQKAVAEKAKRQLKRTEEKKVQEAPKTAHFEGELDKEIEKLISDDQINL